MMNKIGPAKQGVLFLGDVAWPHVEPPVVEGLPADGVDVVVNLEGPILETPAEMRLDRRRWCGIYNDPKILDFFEQIGVTAVTLGNNHISDFVGGLEQTAARLRTAGIPIVGTGGTACEACNGIVMQPIRSTTECVLFSGAEFMTGANFAGRRGAGVADAEKQHFVDAIASARRLQPEVRIVVLPHWGYEGCNWPSPLQRTLARRFVEAGASVVVGHHPHLVQGVETVEKSPIIYSIGNFCFAQTEFRGVAIHYPKEWSRGDAVLVTDVGAYLIPVEGTFGPNVVVRWDLAKAVPEQAGDWYDSKEALSTYRKRYRAATGLAWRYPVFSGSERHVVFALKRAQMTVLRILKWCLARATGWNRVGGSTWRP